jgi:hypothetical protein
MNRPSIRAAFGVALVAALASLPQGVHARDPGLNQPGRAGSVGGVARRSVRF